MTLRVTSADGTRIAYDRKGTGPAVILVGGTLDDGAENAPLARLLANHFTVYNYARRGRGASGNTPPYAVAREVEDLDALIATAGGSVHVYGASSGGALALEAAAAGSAIDKIAVWDVPYAIGDDLRPRFNQYLADTHEAYKAGRPGRGAPGTVHEAYRRTRRGNCRWQTAPVLGHVGRARPHARQRRRDPQ